MPRHTVADSLRRQRYLALVLAAKSAMRSALSQQLELLNCTVVCVETTAEAQALVAKRPPHFLFLECSHFPMYVREIAGLFSTSSGEGRTRPLLIGLSCGQCPADDPGDCGLDDFLQLPPTLNAVENLLELLLPDAAGEAEQTVSPYDCPGLHECDALAQLPEDLQAAMLKAFIDDTAVRLGRIAASLEAYDLKQAARDVHAVKSGCLQIGYTTMAECCDQLRDAIHASDIIGTRACLRALVLAFHSLASHPPRN